MKRYFQLGAITLGLSVAFMSIGFLTKASDLYSGCTDASIVYPPANQTEPLRFNVGDKIHIQVQAGSCDFRIDNLILYSAGLDGGAIISSTHPVAVKAFSLTTVDWQLNQPFTYNAGTLPYLELWMTRRSPSNSAYYKDEVFKQPFNMTVQGTASPSPSGPRAADVSGGSTQPAATLAACPATQYLTPSAGQTVSGQLAIDLKDNSNHNLWFFDITSSNSTPQHQETNQDHTTWNTAEVPNGTYQITSRAQCSDTSKYQSTSSPQTISVVVNNAAGQPANGNTGSSSTVTYVTPSGESIQVKPALLAEPAYRKVIAVAQSQALSITTVQPIVENKKVSKFKFAGKAMAKTKYSLFVFSQPKQLDFTSDQDGNWEVELDQSLTPGDHEAYIVLNDTKGKPLERSSVLNFVVPTAEAAAQVGALSASATATARAKLYAAYSGLTVVIAIFIFVGYEETKRRLSSGRKKPPTQPTPIAGE